MPEKKQKNLSSNTAGKRRRRKKIARKKIKRGLFITFEGVEGSGKTLQAQKLHNFLKTNGYPVNLTCEPGGTYTGKLIRDILLDSSSRITPYTELFLYLADRAQHISEKIKPGLNKNEIVISDRYFDSTIAYQMGGREITEKEINRLKNIKIFKEVIPDITFVLDIDPEITKTRLNKPDRIEMEDSDFHKRIRKTYLKLAENNPERITIIDAGTTIEKIHLEIKEKVTEKLREVVYE